jgi:hypothetical protein
MAGLLSSSACFTSSSATVDIALYENRLHPLIAELPYASPCCRLEGWAEAHSASSCSLTGTRVSVSTLALADHRSIIAWPYWLAPSMTCVSGRDTASEVDVDATSRAICDRLCQNTAPASSTLSKKSSSEYSPAPHPPSTEW